MSRGVGELVKGCLDEGARAWWGLGEVWARFGDEMGKVTCIPMNSAGMPRQPQFAPRSSALVMFDLRDDRLSAQQTDRNHSSHSAV